MTLLESLEGERARFQRVLAYLGLAPYPDVRASERADEAWLERQRRRMLERHIVGRGIRDARVVEALRQVPRQTFVPATLRAAAYDDRPLPIGYGQTISQPYIVALMTESLRLGGAERVLEIGAGSGYQTAVLAAVAGSVFSLEIRPELASRARHALDEVGATNVQLRVGDGYHGWLEAAPFDAILVAAAPSALPQPLLAQLALGGRMVLPVGCAEHQVLRRIVRTESGFESETLTPVRFVPMTGAAQDQEGRT